MVAVLSSTVYFYPRSPCGERPQIFYRVGIAIDISIHALLAESDCGLPTIKCPETTISIHALLAESDPQQCSFDQRFVISIHALLAESDRAFQNFPTVNREFLSTLSLRRATARSPQLSSATLFLSTLSLRRATRGAANCYLDNIISIHALLAESDGIGLVFLWWGVRFLSTLSLRRATG